MTRPHITMPARRALSDQTVLSLDKRVGVPTFDRRALRPGVVHIGVGGFHRAHQAVYLDDLARRGDTAWGEIGVGLRSPAVRDALVAQDCLFTVVERGPRGDTARAIGSMIRYRYRAERPRSGA
jgi:fructuronate reductase/mannitol 2-dehydrogenase